MNAYIWEWTEPVSVNWHPGGGLLIVAATIEAARELWSAHCASTTTRWDTVDTLEPGAADADPDIVLPLDPAATVEPRVMTFPDAGCC